ncbi:MAG: HEAT repeat domain-containing protein [Candidatus Aminicenantes bacterium]|nr:HEAT repeat domain-containing protein [Candidatus Aminicenantes bacterium]
MRRIGLFLGLAVVAAGIAAAPVRKGNRPPAQVLRPAAESGALAARLDWALGEAPGAGPGGVFWAGYSIERLMGERSHIGSYTVGGSGRDLTIAEVLAGANSAAAPSAAGDDLQGAARAALDEIDRHGKPEKKVLKDLGVFFKYERGKTPVLADVSISNLDLAFDFEGAPLFWLGKVPEDQSLTLIKTLYGRNRGSKVREGLVAAAGCHGTPRLVVPFLETVLTGDGPDDLRKDAAFWIGQQNDPDGLRLLVRTARGDRSEEVREGAVFSISQVELPEAVDEIITLARSAEAHDVRKQAVFWLGQMASEKSGKALVELARTDGEIEIQEQAVFALSQLPDNQGVDALIKLAKTHPDPRVRKKAVFWLGECDDPRALETLIAIIKGK